ncbi:hypothetical protein IWQ62_002170 [Dispira parvispora]|uniref:Transposase Tc1-like domain-containing protein n=1 Tax=Dispira parvispora TaxID=1520584 RepID=A0A9W8AQW0_9FUNG|nr:hypothetical protein IWQ62_002170 [Dispira parvispora]
MRPITETKKHEIIELLNDGHNKETAVEVQSSLEEELGVKASESTVRRALKEGRLRATKKRKKP